MSPCQQPLPRTFPGTGPPDPASLAPVPEVDSLTRTRRLPFSPTRHLATLWGARPSAGSCGNRGLRGGGARGAPRHPPTPDPSHLSLQAPVHSTRPHGFRSRSSRSLVKPSDTYGRHGHWGAWCLDTSGSPPPGFLTLCVPVTEYACPFTSPSPVRYSPRLLWAEDRETQWGTGGWLLLLALPPPATKAGVTLSTQLNGAGLLEGVGVGK